MYTLNSWVSRLTCCPQTIECPQMKIIGHGEDSVLFVGPGHLYIKSRTTIEFVMFAKPCSEISHRSLIDARKNPDSIFHQLRLLPTGFDGTEWRCGWTRVRIGGECEGVLRLSGILNSLSTDVSGGGVSPDSSVELVYDDRLRLPIPGNMVTTVVVDGEQILSSSSRGRNTVQVAGTTIDFSFTPDGERVWAVAKTSSGFRHPYAENWISEPLCMLLGQLVFPRLVARNYGDGTATIWLRPSPEHKAETLVATILGEDPYASPDKFWCLYQDILTMIVNARDESGNPNFEAHPLTHNYHEIVQATKSSCWVLCMTLSSIAEGIAKMLADPHELKSEFLDNEIYDLKKYIKAWSGNERLRERVVSSVERARTNGIKNFLKSKQREGVIEAKHVDAWDSVRNHVMHGNLVSPWLDEKLEERLWCLIELVHKLSLAYIIKCVPIDQDFESNDLSSDCFDSEPLDLEAHK